MLLSLGLSIGVLVYLAFIFDMLGFMARDELWLRLLMLTASAFYLVYYFFVTDTPLWDALITNGVLAGINLVMIVIVVLERTTITMSEEHAQLYRSFSMLTPGQFRRLIRAAEEAEATAPRSLTENGAPLDRLYYVSRGPVVVDKYGHKTRIADQTFVGEIAYLTGGPATADVTVEPGAKYLVWPVEKLHELSRKHPALQVALAAQLNVDLAHKVAHSAPVEDAGAGVLH